VATISSLVETAQIYKELIPLDCSMTICDDQGVVMKFLPAKTFTLNINIGEKIAAGGATDECLRTGRPVVRILPQEVLGVAIKAISIPVFEDGKITGAAAIGVSLGIQKTLQESAQTIAATAEEMTATTEEIAASASVLSNRLQELNAGSQRVLTEIDGTDEILQFTTNIAANSNLLGLNAAIEAARAGEHGRGFSVVAEEIRKMAVSSASAASDIKKILTNIRSETTKMVSTIQETSVLGETQATATQQISTAMVQLASSAADIEKVAETL